jgi:hypothetical protein
MRDDVRQALAVDASSTIEDRTIDITTVGRRSGEPRPIEIAFVAQALVRPGGLPVLDRPSCTWSACDYFLPAIPVPLAGPGQARRLSCQWRSGRKPGHRALRLVCSRTGRDGHRWGKGRWV